MLQILNQGNNEKSIQKLRDAVNRHHQEISKLSLAKTEINQALIERKQVVIKAYQRLIDIHDQRRADA